MYRTHLSWGFRDNFTYNDFYVINFLLVRTVYDLMSSKDCILSCFFN